MDMQKKDMRVEAVAEGAGHTVQVILLRKSSGSSSSLAPNRDGPEATGHLHGISMTTHQKHTPL